MNYMGKRYIVGYWSLGFRICYETDHLDQALQWVEEDDEPEILVIYERK